MTRWDNVLQVDDNCWAAGCFSPAPACTWSFAVRTSRSCFCSRCTGFTGRTSSSRCLRFRKKLREMREIAGAFRRTATADAAARDHPAAALQRGDGRGAPPRARRAASTTRANKLEIQVLDDSTDETRLARARRTSSRLAEDPATATSTSSTSTASIARATRPARSTRASRSPRASSSRSSTPTSSRSPTSCARSSPHFSTIRRSAWCRRAGAT